jgi:putative GTP pyrophosphokinase
MSKTQIDRLGDRLKKGTISEAHLRLLDQYRRSFAEAYDIVVNVIRKGLAWEPTGRPVKSTTSIVEKLQRESIRLTQIQDIAGCRLIVPDIAIQETVVQSLKSLFEDTTVIDRRQKPSHGYRAVHVLVSCFDKTIEVQVRTSLQHLWAELSEKFSDIVDPAIKYGKGEEWTRVLLMHTSDMVAGVEFDEAKLAEKKQKTREKLQEVINILSKYSEEN